MTEWEMLVVDNASEQPVENEIRIDWHPNGRFIREQKIGVVHARLRGIGESRGGLIVFVDDDNILDRNYLNKVLEIARMHPMLGAWSGQVLPEFEIAPPDDTRQFLELLCIRTFKRDIWGNDLAWNQLPWGAGMCVRREVALRYHQEASKNPLRLSLGHAGRRPSSHEDTDIAITSFDIGYGTGIFFQLTLTHLIRERRLNTKYLLELAENGAAAFFVMKSARGLIAETSQPRMRKLIDWLTYWAAAPAQRKAIEARSRGEKLGRSMVANLATPEIKPNIQETELNIKQSFN
jgi:hypothetical protein